MNFKENIKKIIIKKPLKLDCGEIINNYPHLPWNWEGMSYNNMDKGKQKWIRQKIQKTLFQQLLQNNILSEEVVRYIVSFV